MLYKINQPLWRVKHPQQLVHITPTALTPSPLIRYPEFMKKLYRNIINFDLKAALTRWFVQLNRPFVAAFITAFIALNLIFLYHGAHFLFGDHDWKYLKNGLTLSDGLFEGRFSQFILINLLTSGDILPLINNLIGFLGYSLGIALLARYWQLPNTKKAYVLFALFATITPYILSFMYFAFLIPAVLSWNAVVITALIISEKETRFSLSKTLLATLLLTLALGGYPPVINLIGTAFAARLLFASLSPSPTVSHTTPTSHCEPRDVRSTTPKQTSLSVARAEQPTQHLVVRTSRKASAFRSGTIHNSCEAHNSSSSPQFKTENCSQEQFCQGDGECRCYKGRRERGVHKAYISERRRLYDRCYPSPLFHTYRYTFLNIILALITYKLCLLYFTHTGAINPNYYNLQTITLAEIPQKALLTLQNLIKQFGITLPFISLKYKIITAALTLLALTTIIPSLKREAHNSSPSVSYITPSPIAGEEYCERTTDVLQRRGAYIEVRDPTEDRLPSVSYITIFFPAIFFLATLLAPLSTFFLSTSLAETEFSPRIDFFGFAYAIAAMLALCLKSPKIWLKNVALLLAISSIFISARALFAAQKTWHLGFTAEMAYYRRILKRYEQNDLFNPQNRYIIVQAGSPSFRQKYEHTPYNRSSDDLLDISYTPGLNSGVMWNYYAPTPYADETSYVYTFTPTPEFKQQLAKAAPYPKENSVAVGPYWLLLTLTPQSLQNLRTRYQ